MSRVSEGCQKNILREFKDNPGNPSKVQVVQAIQVVRGVHLPKSIASAAANNIILAKAGKYYGMDL